MKKSSKKNTVAKVAEKDKGVPSAAKAASAVKFTRERHELAVRELTPAPWNPRGEIPTESVADLVASIASVGVIEPVVVMPSAKHGKYIIIAGHRRVKAAELAGLDKIPADVLVGVDVTTAKHMTFIENLQRRDADPLLESNLVAELVADGMTTDEIAAEIGRDRKWVLRRKNLANLSPSWRKRVAKGENITTDCLEHIAAFPRDIQEKTSSIWRQHCGALRWYDIAGNFSRETQDLSGAKFDTAPCMSCANNSGCSPDLFDWDGAKPAALGKCMCEKCYRKKLAAYIDYLVKKAEADGVAVVRKEPSYDVTKSIKRTKECSVLHVWKNFSGGVDTLWCSLPRKNKPAAALSPQERERQLVEKRRVREHNAAIRALGAWCAAGDDFAKLLGDYFLDTNTSEVNYAAPFIVEAAFINIAPTVAVVGAKTDRRKVGISALFNHLRVPDEWTRSLAAAIAQTLDPNRCGGEDNAKLILAMFPSIRKEIGEDVAEKIISAAAADKLKCPAIKWSAGVLPKGSAAAESSDANEDAPDNGEDAGEE